MTDKDGLHVIPDVVRDLWLKAKPQHVENYTTPLLSATGAAEVTLPNDVARCAGVEDQGKTMKPLYIFDLDGTLANIEHRTPILAEKHDRNRWRRFYAACDKDAPITSVITTMERLRRFADVWIFSGRSEEVRHKTVEWLVEHTSFMSHDLATALTMRQEGDHRPDDVVKREWWDGMLQEDRQRLVAVFDDRDRVVAMWRKAGVHCFQVAPGAF